MRIRALFTLVPLALLSFLFVGVSQAVIPIRRYDEHGVIEKVREATEAEQKAGVIATINLKGSDRPIEVTKQTDVHRQKGKLVPAVSANELKEGQRVSVWLRDKSNQAEAVLIFP